MDKDITVSLELRTHKTEGILMIADGSNGSPIMSLQLTDGQVGSLGIIQSDITSYKLVH